LAAAETGEEEFTIVMIIASKVVVAAFREDTLTMNGRVSVPSLGRAGGLIRPVSERARRAGARREVVDTHHYSRAP